MLKTSLLALCLLAPLSAKAQIPMARYAGEAHEQLQARQAEHRKAWGLGQESGWEASLERGTIGFLFADGRKVSAPIQVIGTHDPSDNSFVWSWANKTIPAALTDHAKQLKAFGEHNGIKSFTQPIQQPVDEDQAWIFVTVAHRLAQANGVYRIRHGKVWYYLTFGATSVEAKAQGKE